MIDAVFPPDDDGPAGDPETTARLICLQLLERSARTRAELATALRKRGVPADAATAVLDRFTDVGLIDDAGLATVVAAAQHEGRGLGRQAVAVKLRRRGIDESVVQSVVAGIDRTSEWTAAERLVRRRLPALRALEPPVQARRLVGMLGRRGYPTGLAFEVVRTVLAAAGDVGADDESWFIPDDE